MTIKCHVQRNNSGRRYDQAVQPLRIYTRTSPALPTSPTGRFVAAALSLFCVSLLTLAAWLTPASSGFGTHTQLGLTPCDFFVRTGVPCPGCGMTTAFSHTVRGHFLTAAYTQPMGFVLALVAALVAWGAGYEAVTGRQVHRLLRGIGGLAGGGGLGLVWLGLGLTVVAWAWKIALTIWLGH